LFALSLTCGGGGGFSGDGGDSDDGGGGSGDMSYFSAAIDVERICVLRDNMGAAPFCMG